MRSRWRRLLGPRDGFTLVELVITVAILGIIVVPLTGVVLAYLRNTVDTQSRLTESHDVQFAAAYWQRDVASIGVRSTTYDPAAAVHSYALLQSVNVAPSCALPSGMTAATLAWSSYDVTDPDHPTTVTVSYVAAQSNARWTLTRVRCTAAHVDSTITVADACDGEARADPHLPGRGRRVHRSRCTRAHRRGHDPDVERPRRSRHRELQRATLTGQRRQS